MYYAVLNAAKRSLVTLAEASGCELSTNMGPDGDYAHDIERIDLLADKPARPLSALSTLSDMTWKSDMEKEITYLQ